MFGNSRFATNGVVSEIEESTQLAMWNLIDHLHIRRDYLQVFHLSYVNINGMDMQQIIHEQEQPAFREVIVIPAYYPVLLDVFVIDDGSQSTMLLSCEY